MALSSSRSFELVGIARSSVIIILLIVIICAVGYLLYVIAALVGNRFLFGGGVDEPWRSFFVTIKNVGINLGDEGEVLAPVRLDIYGMVVCSTFREIVKVE